MQNLKVKSIAVACGLATLVALAPEVSAQTAPSTAPFAFSQSRPRLVVLLHGVTPKPTESPEQFIGQTGHARHYWGYEFIKGLQGRPAEAQMTVVTPLVGGGLRGRNIFADSWQPEQSNVWAIERAPICFPMSNTNVLPASAETDTAFIKNYISRMASTPGAQNTMVMINTRDGSKHLMPQVNETVEELYFSYTAAFGHLPESQQPQIYLVGHSFGGVIARAILANPTGPDLFGNSLSSTRRLQADYLRKRVVLVKTLGTPHEGSIIADPAGDFADYVATYGYSILLGAIAGYNYFTSGNMTSSEMRQSAQTLIQYALDAISGKRDCLKDITRMNEYNTGILRPDTARRAPNGPMVPIYTAAARNPGSTHYDADRSVFLLGGLEYNPISTFDLFSASRSAKEATALNLISALMRIEGYGKEGKRPWGTATDSNGDRVSIPFVGLGASQARPVSAGWHPTNSAIYGVVSELLRGKPYRVGVGDGEWDDDGFVGWDSGHAYHLNTTNYYRVYDNARYGDLLPWDNDHHGNIMFNIATGSWIHNELIRNAGPIVKSGARTSVWNSFDNPVTPSTNIRVEVLEVKDARKSLDYASGADFRISVKIGGWETTRNLPESDIVSNLSPFTAANLRNTVVPIKVSLIERDTPDPDDLCVLYPKRGQSSLYFYFDTRTNRVIGDLNGAAGSIITTRPIYGGVGNPVETKIRVTRY